jgi:hypothetical protein
MSSSDELQWPDKQPTPSGCKQDNAGKLCGISANTNWTELLLVGRARRSILQDSVNCAAHEMRSETRCICKFCVVPLHMGSCLKKYYSLRNY